MRRASFIAAVALLLVGCTTKHATVLEGDTALEMQSSILTLAADLPASRRQEFDQAIATIIFSATDKRFTQKGDRLTPQSIGMLKGRTVHQVIEDAKLIRTVAGSY